MQMSLQSQLSQKETLKRGSQELAISTTWPSAWWTLLSTKAKSLSTKAKLLCNDQSVFSPVSLPASAPSCPEESPVCTAPRSSFLSAAIFKWILLKETLNFFQRA